MSEDANTSLLSNFTNKIKYKLHEATYDPKANEFAQKQAETQKKVDEEKQTATIEATEKKEIEENGDPNKFSGKRLVKKIGNQTLDILKKAFLPFLGLMLAMVVTNEMIIYSVPIRVIFFLFTFFIVIFTPFYGVLLGFFYLVKAGYSYYYNNMTDRPKREIMPSIFALMPVTMYQPTSQLGSIFLYPFTYPKTELDAQKLPVIMKQYWDDLQSSFKHLDTIRNLPIFSEQLKNIQVQLKEINTAPEPNITVARSAPTSIAPSNMENKTLEPTPSAPNENNPQ
jgi:hypothetical protein